MSHKLKLKKKEDIINLRHSGRVLAQTLNVMVRSTRAGITTHDLDSIAHDFIVSNEGCSAAFLNYKPYGAQYPYPATICISVNDEVVHGIPSDYMLIVGDVVSYDGGVKYKGMISDSAVTVIVTADGCVTINDILKKHDDSIVLSDIEKLLLNTYQSMLAGVHAAKIGDRVNQVSKAIAAKIDKRYGVIKTFAGHGVGYHVHEEPFVPNYDDGVEGPIMRDGLVIAIEPMLTLGTDEVDILDDGYTAVTADGSISAHFEHTVLVGERGGEILTSL